MHEDYCADVADDKAMFRQIDGARCQVELS
jgi:hypothetical protein